MSLMSATIQFERSSESYRPGEVIQGLVILQVNGGSTILIKALSIKFSGYASCKWEKQQEAKKSGKPKDVEYYTNREDYVCTENFLLGSEQANPRAMQPGVYNYNFMVQIPLTAPSSFESPKGSIRYELQVNADYIDHNDCLCSALINVKALKDLRRLGSAMQTPTETEKIESKPCLKFWQNPLRLYISVPQGGYVVGENISVHIKICNYGKIKLKDITTKLNRLATYKGAIKEKKPNETSEATNISCHIHSLLGQNSSIIQHFQQICVPQTTPSLEFAECKCISVNYELEVTITTQNQKRFVQAGIAILVGSISLASDVKILENNVAASSHVPSISVARSMDELNVPSRLDMQEENHDLQHACQMSVSMTSLASSFQEAEYMTPVKMNKKSKTSLSGDPVDFKPKYLVYDLPEELQANLREDEEPTPSQLHQKQSIITVTTDEQF